MALVNGDIVRISRVNWGIWRCNKLDAIHNELLISSYNRQSIHTPIEIKFAFFFFFFLNVKTQKVTYIVDTLRAL